MRRSDFLTRKERLRIKWSNLKFFVYGIFHRISKFQNLEVTSTVRIKPRKKRLLISGNLIHKDGKLIVEKKLKMEHISTIGQRRIKGDKNE